MPSPPEHAYLVCATQRSGSTLLCETLRETGVAGRPLEHFQHRRATGRPPQPREYFDGLQDDEVLSLLAPTPDPDPSSEPSPTWWERVLAGGTTANGVWGGKLMWDQTGDMTSHFAEILGRPEVTLREGIAELLGDARFVFVTRPDRVDQAVSLWKAVQTQQWRGGSEAGPADPRYSFAGIRHLVQWVERNDEAWRAWFAAQEVEALTIDYEQLSEDPQDQVRAVLRHLGQGEAEVPEPPLRRQGDDTSRRWAERYREEAAVTT